MGGREAQPFYQDFIGHLQPDQTPRAAHLALLEAASSAPMQLSEASGQQVLASAKDKPWSGFGAAARPAWAAAAVQEASARILGRAVKPQETFVSAGLDSLGGQPPLFGSRVHSRSQPCSMHRSCLP